MSTFVNQVGGSHYGARVQHWDLMEEFDIDYLAATGTKYIDRHRSKGTPLEDLMKGSSYFEKIKANRRGVRRTVPLEAFIDYVMCHDYNREQITIQCLVLVVGTRAALDRAIEMTKALWTKERWPEPEPNQSKR